MFLRTRTGLCRLFTALLVILPVTSALGDEEKATAAILQELLKRIDSLEVQNKELRNQLERPAVPDPTMGALVEQLRVLQERLDALEKVKPTAPAPPTTDLAKPEKPETTSLLEGQKPSGAQGMSKLVEDLLDDRAKAGVRKRPEQEEVRYKAKEFEQKKADWFEVGKNMKMGATWNHGLQFTSEDEAFKFHIGGRVDFDNAWYRTDNNLLFGSSDEIGLHDGTDFRRMRLRADGRFWDFVDFVFEVNFANLQDFSNTDQAITVGSVGLTDVNLTFRPLPVVGNIKVGHFLPPISLEHMSSSNYTYYMERSPQFDAFINRFDYANGVSFFNSYRDDRVTFSAALLRTGSRTVNPFGAGSGDGQYGYAFRTTMLPLYEEEGRRLLHLGISFMSRALDQESTSPGDRALVRGGASGNQIPNVMQTGRFYSPDGEYYLNPEFAIVAGPFSLSGEYLYTQIPKAYRRQVGGELAKDPVGPVSYQGYYIDAGWFLTPGDSRRYNKKLGAWDRTVPLENAWLMKGPDGHVSAGRGAVQLLARYSYLDLVSGVPVLTPRTGARAGIEQDITLGVAWYLNPQSNIQLNYIRTHILSVLPTASGSFDALGLRFHFDF